MANFITILRTFLSFLAIGLLFVPKTSFYVTAFVLTGLIIWMDGIDGYVARKFNETSKFGAFLDILGDRIVENVYWVSFLALGWIPLWIPLTVLTRGIITDGLRSLAFEKGFTAFGKTTMMQSKIGRFIVASNFVRFSYALFKAVAFCLLIFAHIPDWSYQGQNIVALIAYASAYITAFLCVLRGIPVIIESKRFFKE